MNLEKVFEFIKEKRGYNIPIRYKLINGLPLSEDELNVEGRLDLSYTKIKSLPDNLKVGGSLNLRDTNIESLPDNLKVGRDLILENTPLSEKYREEDIRKIIEDKGGFVKRHIFI